MKAVIEKINSDNTLTCEDCGETVRLGHMVVYHPTETVKAVCHSCFVAKYQAGIYGPEFRA